MKSVIDELKYGRRFLSFTFLKTVGQVLLFGVPLLLPKLLNPDAFGAYSLSMMIAYFFTAIFLGSTASPFIVYASDEMRISGKINRTTTSWMIILGASALLFAGLAILLSRQITQFAAIDHRQLALLFVAYMGLGLRRAAEAVLLALDKKGANVAVGIIAGVLSIALIVAVHYFYGVTINRIFLILFSAQLTAVLLMSSHFDRDKLFPLIVDRQLLKELLGHMKWTFLGGAAVYLFNWGDNIVLRYFVSLDDIGTYNLGYQIFKGVTIILGTIRVYFLPFLSQHADEPAVIRNFLSNKRWKIMLLGSVSISSLMIALPFSIRTFYGAAYENTISVALVLLISSFFILYRVLYDTLLSAWKQYKFTQLATVCFVFLNLGLDVLLVMRMGAIGAAYATAITYIAYAIAFEVYFRRYMRDRLSIPVQQKTA